jgi:Protein of unknown function (DUF3105)
MASTDQQAASGAQRLRAIARYALVWITVAAIGSAVVIAVLREPAAPATLPPVRQIQLTVAAREAGCALRRSDGGRRVSTLIDGRRGAPARAAFYDSAVPVARLAAAVRRGLVVIAYRAGLERKRVEQLRALQRVAPRGTIVTPGGVRTSAEIVIAAYRRVLACPRFTDVALDALRLFRGRYIGGGPDR